MTVMGSSQNPWPAFPAVIAALYGNSALREWSSLPARAVARRDVVRVSLLTLSET